MQRYLAVILALMFLSGCGADVLSTVATVGTAQKKNIEEAQKTQDEIIQKLDRANQTAEQQLEEAERQSNY